MKASDLAKIADPRVRLIQSMKFLRSIKDAEEAAAKIRDLSLLEVRDESNPARPTQQQLADDLQVSSQRVGELERKAKTRYGK